MKPPDDRDMIELSRRTGDLAMLADVEEVYAELNAAAIANRAACRQCGRCCRFKEFGHQLFVSSGELVYFLASWKSSNRLFPAGPAEEGRCPFQEGASCTVREFRPLGCRLFFCQDGDSWGVPLYERLHGRLGALCRIRRLPYLYVEWTAALRALRRLELLKSA